MRRPYRDSATARRSAIDSSIFHATCGRDSTNGRNTNTGSPYAVTSLTAVTVAVRGRRSMRAISPKDEPGPSVATDSPCMLDGKLTALDDEEHQAPLAFERDLVSRGEATLVELLGEALEIPLVDVGEEANVA